jgi:NAD(P)-dependent dehydrogenase (short-subunit alcohol dehydrogenase family)
MDFRDRHVVITGGAGALGTAVVTALVEAGAVCHVPCFNEAEAQRFSLRDHKQVKVIVAGNLADETTVAALGVDPDCGRLCRRTVGPDSSRNDSPADRNESD